MVRNIHKKNPIDVCSNSRSILTSSCVGKVYGRALRRRPLPAALNYAADTQCGGFPGRSPEFASHCARFFFLLRGAKPEDGLMPQSFLMQHQLFTR